MAICTELVELVSVPLIVNAPLPGAPPVNPVPAGADQLYVVPAGTMPLVLFTGVTVNPLPLQTIAVIGVMAGFGLTVTVTVKVAPVHVPVTGVTVYVAVCTRFVEFTRDPVMFAEDPPLATPPDKPAVTIGTVQL